MLGLSDCAVFQLQMSEEWSEVSLYSIHTVLVTGGDCKVNAVSLTHMCPV